MLSALPEITADMACAGIRRLLIISGDNVWCGKQASYLTDLLPGDWLWVGDSPDRVNSCAPSALRTLLGREIKHAIFDARSGMDVQALAALTGTLKAGSWLVLLAPVWKRWATMPDKDACRWSDTPVPIATPRFITYLQRCVIDDEESILWQQHSPFFVPDFASRSCWSPATGKPEQQQADVLTALCKMPPGIAVVTAARGRGKSALAGMLLQRISGKAWVSAPGKSSTDVLAQYAGDKFHFIAPDALLAQPVPEDVTWLVIDEAAALPGPQLRRMIAHFSHTLLTTSVQGYEGTGRGFMLKLCATIDNITHYTLSAPVRWAPGDPLERIIDNILLLDDVIAEPALHHPIVFSTIESDDSRVPVYLFAQMYRLLSAAHYRTSPLDWRRMLDAPGQRFILAQSDEKTVAAAWLVEEGGLDASLSHAIWAGVRRPRGNLVAQSLAAHGKSPLAATLRGIRISRIAVLPVLQRQNVGQRLIMTAKDYARAGYDYLSVSFGYTVELWRFWQYCGFILVRFGSHQEASSGCYTAMALLPLTSAGRLLANHESWRLRRDMRWLQPWIAVTLPIETADGDELDEDDWLDLAGFAYGHRSLEACLGALNRLLLKSQLPLRALRERLKTHCDVVTVCQRLEISGRKALMTVMRQETQQALYHLDVTRHDDVKALVLSYCD